MLIHQNERHSPDFIHCWVWLAQMALTGFLLSVSLSRLIEAIYPLVGKEKCKPFTFFIFILGRVFMSLSQTDDICWEQDLECSPLYV